MNLNSSRFFRNLFGVLVLFAIIVGWSCADVANAQRGNQGPAPVVSSKVIKLRRAGMETFVGTLRPIRQTTVGSAVDGRVLSVPVAEGDPVGPAKENASNETEFLGQPLVQLRTQTLDIEIDGAKIQHQLAQQILDELEISIPKNIESSKALLAGAKAKLAYSQANLDRSKNLSGQAGAISELELEQARSQFQADQQTMLSAEADYQRLVTTKEILLAQARSRLDASAQEVKRLEDRREKYTIRAPFEGFAIKKSTEVGAWVRQGDPIFELVQLNPIEMVINVPQDYIVRLQASIAASIQEDRPLVTHLTVQGIETTMQGVVKRIIPQADLRSRSFPVRVELNNPKNAGGFLLQPGMLGQASLEIGAEKEMLMIKKDALVLGGRDVAVYKVVKQGEKTTTVPVPVKTGAAFGQWIEVSGQLNEGDEIVVLGNERLRPGQEIEVTKTDDELPDGQKAKSR